MAGYSFTLRAWPITSQKNKFTSKPSNNIVIYKKPNSVLGRGRESKICEAALFVNMVRMVKARSLSPCLHNALSLTPKKGSSKTEKETKHPLHCLALRKQRDYKRTPHPTAGMHRDSRVRIYNKQIKLIQSTFISTTDIKGIKCLVGLKN